MKDIARMFLIYPHLIACCTAIGATVLADFRLVRSRGEPTPADVGLIKQMAGAVTVALAILWVTGAGIIWLDFGHLPSLYEIVAKPKLVTKLLVVVAFTLNGTLLHPGCSAQAHRRRATVTAGWI